MSDNEARIEHLVRTVPTIERTRRQKVVRVVSIVANVVAFLSLALFVVATVQNSNLANCTNTNLSQRDAPNTADRLAIDTLFRTQGADLRKIVRPGATQAQKSAAFADYLAAYKVYAIQRAADDQAREAHPIGKC